MNNPIDVSQWTRLHSDEKHPFWWGILGLIAIEATVLLGFMVSYFYLWIVSLSPERANWPVDMTPHMLLPTLECLLLIFCAWTMWYGGIVMHKGQNLKFAWLTFWCCTSSAIVLYSRWTQLSELPYDWKFNSFASFVWFLTGFHFLHVLSALLGTVVIGWLAFKGYYTEQRMLGVQVDTMYWYFVVVAWFPIYFVLYLVPRIIR